MTSIDRTIETGVLDFLDLQVSGTAPYSDVLEKVPALSLEDAYRIQFALKDRCVSRGDPIIGYKVAYTSRKMQKSYASGGDGPRIGTLLKSHQLREGDPLLLNEGNTLVEPEIAVVMKKRLAGPGVNIIDVLGAIEGYQPAFEFAFHSPGKLQRSPQHSISTHKSDGAILAGKRLHPPYGLDLRVEGATLSINNEPQVSGTGVEVLNDPLQSVVVVANLLGRFGRCLEPGMLVLTGSIVSAPKVTPNDKSACVEFTRLGTLSVNFVPRSNDGM